MPAFAYPTRSTPTSLRRLITAISTVFVIETPATGSEIDPRPASLALRSSHCASVVDVRLPPTDPVMRPRILSPIPMTDVPKTDPDDAAAATERRDEVAERIRSHAGRVARELSLLEGGDYGRRSFETDRGTWTLKYEAGDVQYLRFEQGSDETYVVSSKQPPEPDALADAMTDYDAFVAAFNDHVRSLDGVLDDVETDFPSVASTESIVEERDRVLGRMRECADAMAGQLHRYEGTNYGSFETRVDGTRWELKWEDGRTSYLRIGGEGGLYLISQYQPPSAPDLREHVDDFRGFVEAFNEHVSELSSSLSTVSL